MDSIIYKNHTIKIDQDELMESSRAWDNLGTMVCAHRRYSLGDIQLKNSEFWEHIDLKYMLDGNKENVEKYIEKNIIFLNLFLYDHSGITMNTSGFHCGWDSGKVGIIYVHKDDALKGFSWKKLSKKRLERVYDILRAEVKTYDMYLAGDVYYYQIFNEEDEEIDSLSGIYGYKYAIDEAKQTIDTIFNNKLKENSPTIII